MAPAGGPQMDGRACFSLHQALSIDAAPAFPQDVGRLPRGLQARCMCFHPSKPVLAVALERCLVEFDTLTGAKLGSVQLADMPVDMQFLPDGNALVVLMQSCSIVAWSTSTWQSRIICPPNEKYLGDKGIVEGHLAIGHNVLFYAQHLRTSIRGVLWNAKPQDKKNSLKLKFDNYKKPIVGLTCPPGGKQLYVAYADATVRAYTIVNGTLAFSLSSLAGKEAKASALSGALSVAAHPLLPSAHLLMAAYSNGRVGVWEVTGSGAQPRRLGQVELMDVSAIVGIGLQRPAGAVAVIAYNAAASSYVPYVWQIVCDPRTREISLVSAKVEPRELLGLLVGPQEQAQGDTTAAPWLQPSWDNAPQSGASAAAIRAVHISPLDGSMAVHVCSPAGVAAGQPPKLICELSAAEFTSARQLLSVPILQLTSSSPTDLGLHGSFSPIHTSSEFWSERPRGQPLEFSSSLHVLCSGQLQVRQLPGGTAQPVKLPSVDDNGSPVDAKHIVESPAQQACLVFFCSLDVPAKGTKGGPKQAWRFTCLVRHQTPGPGEWWFLPGVSGAFLGEDGAHFAVLEQSMARAAVYLTEDMKSLSPPLHFVTLSSPAAGMFAGPPSAQAPERDDSQDDADAGGLLELSDDMEAARAEAALWVTQEGALQLCAVPLEAHRGEGADPGELAAQAVTAQLQLDAGERVLQVAWQRLGPSEAAAGTACVGAILTSVRLMVVTSQLKVVLQHEPSTESRGAPARIINCLWVGPALLFVNASSQVMMLGWDGSCHHVCSIAENGAPPMLAAAMADRLLMLRPPESGDAMELCTRAVRLFQPLAISWATLASSGLLAGGVPRMRAALHSLSASFDACSPDRELLGTLLLHGAGDLASALADASTGVPLAAEDAITCHALAGHWSRAADALLESYQRSIYYPGPPPPGSTLHLRMLALARGATAYGQFQTAGKLYKVAGEVPDLLVLAFLAGDFQTLQRYTAYGLSAASDGEAPPRSAAAAAEARQLALALISANEDAFQSGAPGDMQWQLVRQPVPGAAGSSGSGWDLAPPGALPEMRVAAASEGEDASTVDPLPLHELVPYLGVNAAAKTSVTSKSRAKKAAADGDDDGSFNEGSPGGGGMGWNPDEDDDGDGGDVDAQEAARQAFQAHADAFNSSDDDSSDASSLASSGRHKLSIKIRAAAAEGSGVQGDTSASLKAAAMSLKLGPPGQFTSRRPPARSASDTSTASTPASSAPSSPRLSARRSPSSKRSSCPAPSSEASSSPAPAVRPFPAPEPPGPAPPAEPAAPPPPAPQGMAPAPDRPRGIHTGGSSLVLFKQGIGEMESGRWQEAVGTLANAMDRMERESATAGMDTGKKQQRVGLMAQYLAAVQLLQYSREAVNGPGAAASGEAMRAKLLRFAASLKLNEHHRLLLQQDAVRRNLEVGNYGYCQGALEGLIAAALDKGASERYAAELQAQLAQCDAKGGANASVPPDEDPVVFGEIVATAADSQEVKFMVQQLYEES